VKGFTTFEPAEVPSKELAERSPETDGEKLKKSSKLRGDAPLVKTIVSKDVLPKGMLAPGGVDTVVRGMVRAADGSPDTPSNAMAKALESNTLFILNLLFGKLIAPPLTVPNPHKW
jgi:hypothetical protein